MVTIGLAIYIISAIGAILYIRYDSEYDETYPDESDGCLQKKFLIITEHLIISQLF